MNISNVENGKSDFKKRNHPAMTDSLFLETNPQCKILKSLQQANLKFETSFEERKIHFDAQCISCKMNQNDIRCNNELSMRAHMSRRNESTATITTVPMFKNSVKWKEKDEKKSSKVERIHKIICT